eukprot:TRINITY_DN27400_c0_g1_i1.p1 TRINITY_DN27400_c0_g1~~TRINITY_DN27400_c0_g1_i1.p1  ORF type:complete len:464 (+),score=53.70 TRINITY_DN27400_c0_g1_i1:78-1469(+)
MFKSITISAVLVAAVLGYVMQLPKVEIPEHMTGHTVVMRDDLISEEEAAGLMQTMKTMKRLPSNTNDLKFYKTRNEHVGEAVPMTEKGGCKHPLMVPNVNRTHCILAGRMDIGKHYIVTGGTLGLKEKYENLVSRLQSFGAYNFDFVKYEWMAKVFEGRNFQDSAKSVCPPTQQYLDPFQFNFIVQVPGQTVATHIDGVYFWGASRFDVPQWLLAAMKFSGLFEKRFIHQVQVVGYIHEWTENRAGEFVFWNHPTDTTPVKLPPKRLAGSALDGSKIIHAATDYSENARAPLLDKSDENVLEYLGDDKWGILVNGDVKHRYTTDDLRISVVYRARCFDSKEDSDRYGNQPDEERLTLNDILEIFREDLRKKNKLPDAPTALDLALLIQDTYIKYPLPPTSLFPVNYCLVPRMFPWTAFVFVPLEIMMYFLRSLRVPVLKVVFGVAHVLIRSSFLGYILLQLIC